MCCTDSKLDDLPAVALCSDWCRFLEEAIHQSGREGVRLMLAQASHMGSVECYLKGMRDTTQVFKKSPAIWTSKAYELQSYPKQLMTKVSWKAQQFDLQTCTGKLL
ncbi:hypothetical protein RHSIM_Rhsim01G0088500 [Rhododendron simsii]|uniref:DUF630 domain-containing protein n=1 Tax=Rhododendron simsii TaxID=118357 RepID=A0A834HK58_RHOSS|nr:hypothetical protein RHSIM_Rhsim01G0088500 [Rhododendron simsii]